MGVPTFTQVMDDYLTDTWYKARPKAIDNILDANVITAALRDLGCFHPQEGEEYLTDDIKYGITLAYPHLQVVFPHRVRLTHDFTVAGDEDRSHVLRTEGSEGLYRIHESIIDIAQL